MKQFILIAGTIYSGFSVILGAMGAHALKKVLSDVPMASFETGVRYQMYHGLILLLVGFIFKFETKLQSYMGWSFVLGTFLFSVSIYALSLSGVMGRSFSFLGPITPIGGLLMIVGWILLLIVIVKEMPRS